MDRFESSNFSASTYQTRPRVFVWNYCVMILMPEEQTPLISVSAVSWQWSNITSIAAAAASCPVSVDWRQMVLQEVAITSICVAHLACRLSVRWQACTPPHPTPPPHPLSSSRCDVTTRLQAGTPYHANTPSPSCLPLLVRVAVASRKLRPVLPTSLVRALIDHGTCT